jgi:hypothetical protein
MHPLGCRKTPKFHQNVTNTGVRLPGPSRRTWPAAAAAGSRGTPKAAAASSKDNPDLEEIVLDDAYYQEIGMTREQAMRQQQEVRQPAGPHDTSLAFKAGAQLQSKRVLCTGAALCNVVCSSSPINVVRHSSRSAQAAVVASLVVGGLLSRSWSYIAGSEETGQRCLTGVLITIV